MKRERGKASYVKVVVGSGMPTIALTVLTLTLLNLTFRFWRFDFFRVVKVRFCHYFVFKIVSCSRGRVVMKLFSLLQTLEGKILLWRKPLWGSNIPYPPELSKFCLVETEDLVLGRSQRRSTSWMDQIRAGLSRAGERLRLRSEVCEGLQQGFPDVSPGIHHETPPVWGKTQEIIQVRVELISISHGQITTWFTPSF